MSSLITHVDKDSPAGNSNINPGDILVRINGHKIKDVLDYKYYSYDKRLLLEIRTSSGKMRFIRIVKLEGRELGLNFDPYLMDQPRACANHCLFCFVDQLPDGMRETLYFKDDDNRLSFLQGNYVTLTNLSDLEIQRMIDMRLSPLNISVHATEPELHNLLLGNKKSARGLEALHRFKDAGMMMNCQIVCCPGLNDGEHLDKTMNDLMSMYPAVQSTSVVPVGLTKFREGLYPLQPFDKGQARKTVAQIEMIGERCLQDFGSRLFYPADELYLKAGLLIPEDEFYEDYPQLENGVGMVRLLITQAEAALGNTIEPLETSFTIATGDAAAPCLQKVLNMVHEKYANINGTVLTIKNDFFGDLIDVAGLLTGGDIIRQLRGKTLGKRLLLTRNMLRHGENVFLDNVTLHEVSQALGVDIRIVASNGNDLVRAICGY